jgi:HlyD family secretion protein
MPDQTATNPKPAARKKSRTWVYILVVLLVVAGLGTAAYIKNKKQGKVTTVTTEKAVIRTITQIVSATGKIQPEIEVKIAPEVAGEIIGLPYREGAEVKKGDLLVRIKSDNYQFQVDQREADLAAAKAASLESQVRLLKAEEDYRRTQEVYELKLVSESDLLAAKTTFDAAKAGVENSQAQIRRAEGLVKQAQDFLEKTTIYSPIDGTISSLSAEAGERVAGTGQYGGAEIMRVADLNNMEVRVNVNENDIINVKIGDHARIAIDAYPGDEFSGAVTEIASSARTVGENTQQEVTDFEVRIRLDSPGVQIRPGMSAIADIETETVTDVVAVPIQSVTVRSREGAKTVDELAAEREKKARETKGEGAAVAVDESTQREQERSDRESLHRVVFVLHGDKVKIVPVETGIADNTHMEIKSGLSAGDEVVSGPYSVISRTLKDDMKVRVRNRSETRTEKTN